MQTMSEMTSLSKIKVIKAKDYINQRDKIDEQTQESQTLVPHGFNQKGSI